jgi:hypothetical protein
MGEVGVEILDGNVASEVTVGGREGGRTWDCSVPMRTKDESVDGLGSVIVLRYLCLSDAVMVETRVT